MVDKMNGYKGIKVVRKGKITTRDVLVQGGEKKEKGKSLQGGQKKGLGKEYRTKRAKRGECLKGVRL